MNLICALDSSGKTASVCLMADGTVLCAHLLDEGLTHSETLLSLLNSAFAEAGLTPADVTLYAVTGGPGSFTGLRIGMSLVKGLALPGGTPALQVSTLAALATASGLQGLVIPALDARRGEVYWAAFACGEQVMRHHADTAGPAAEIAPLACAHPGPVLLVGDGAEICYNSYRYSAHVQVANGPQKPNIALGAARLAHQLQSTAAPAAALRPQYLRLSQAEREGPKHKGGQQHAPANRPGQ